MITRVTQNCKSEIKNYFFRLKLNFQYFNSILRKIEFEYLSFYYETKGGVWSVQGNLQRISVSSLWHVMNFCTNWPLFSYESLNLLVNIIFSKKICNKNIVLDCMLHESLWPGIAFCFVSYINDVWLNKYIYKKKKLRQYYVWDKIIHF